MKVDRLNVGRKDSRFPVRQTDRSNESVQKLTYIKTRLGVTVTPTFFYIWKVFTISSP